MALNMHLSLILQHFSIFCFLLARYEIDKWISLQDLLDRKVIPNVYVFNSLMNVNAHDLGYTFSVFKNMQVTLSHSPFPSLSNTSTHTQFMHEYPHIQKPTQAQMSSTNSHSMNTSFIGEFHCICKFLNAIYLLIIIKLLTWSSFIICWQIQNNQTFRWYSSLLVSPHLLLSYI